MYAVLFDIDGTLVHTGGAGQLAFGEAFCHEFGVAEISKSVAFAGRSDRAIACELMQFHGIEPTEAHWQRFRRRYLQQLPNALRQREGRVLPGVVPLLDELSKRPHVLVGLLTGNVREGARQKLDYYDLGGRFSFGGFGDETNERAQIASVALAAAQATAVDRANGSGPANLHGAMVIGDTVHDVRCARAIGAMAVAVPTGGSTVDELAAERPDLLLQDLTDMAELLHLVGNANRQNGFPESRSG